MNTLPASAASFLPPISQPPHDPTAWLLDHRVGWQVARLEQVTLATGGVLTLALSPEARRSLVEEDGSFGGLSLPTGTALAGDDLFLLDRSYLVLKRFDPCLCRFEEVPCLAGEGSSARQLRDPHGIGLRSGRLYICDSGNHRLSVFSLRGFALLGHWQPPTAAGLSNPWEPYDVTFDNRGRIYVSDRTNSRVHLFSSSGTWMGQWQGLAGASHLTSDKHGKIIVVVEAPQIHARRLTPGWQSEALSDDPAALSPLFETLPFEVDASGRLFLAPLCPSAQPSPAALPEQYVFDLSGNPLQLPPAPPMPRFARSGRYWSAPLDSQIYRCQWHRVILHGELAAGSRVTIATFTSEVLQPPEAILDLPEDAWETNQTASQFIDGAWDCLVRSDGGRYLWLRLQLGGNGLASPRLERIEIEFPRISLRTHLPAVFGQDPVSADFTDRFLSLFDATLRGVERTLDTQARFYDPLSSPSKPLPGSQIDFLTWLGSWIGVALDRHWPEQKQRSFLKQAGRIFDMRGTRLGLWEQLLIYLDMQPRHVANEASRSTFIPQRSCRPRPLNCAQPEPPSCEWQPPRLILEHYQLRRWLFLGTGRLGDQAELWGKSIVNRSQLDQGARVDQTQLITTQDPYRDPFHVYAHKFTLFVPARFQRTDQQRKGLENLLKSESPAHTQFHLEYVEPRFRVGIQAMIGYDAVIGKYPQGVSLGETALGQGSVLTGEGGDEAGDALEVGNRRRIR